MDTQEFQDNLKKKNKVIKRVITAYSIFFAVFVFCLIISFCLDSVRISYSFYNDSKDADSEVFKYEKQVVEKLPSVISDSYLDEMVSSYSSADNFNQRKEIYSKLIQYAEPRLDFDPTDPISRKLSDEFLGLQNRRKVALQRYLEYAEKYNSFIKGFRGSIAKKFIAIPDSLNTD